ncbi:hypothetical protein RJ639_019994 [Escallonia herrerae]|uniref:Polymerase nucleotidyl transferase domain-containing protein n=1 Tax=Escallonia herrerae TaxID=1293975 RepID=A0AA88VB21_9ASTE|nr:hypothetical protein RJ639_019994 [Escallonia herrerae]
MEEFKGYVSSSSSSSLSFQQPHIHADCWLIAERVSHEILSVIQPTVVSEKKRMEVIDFVQKLIRSRCQTEVFPFGSVPLKSYLTDGDIDLTAISYPNDEEDLARRICSILEAEEKENLEFRVENVQYIHAQVSFREIHIAIVKIVKCTVQSIAVDISFNQIPGLYSLCFLEQVDHLIGKDHLFKRSIILIKAWCYYESRILGANHCLISTYALEMLILYIINRFHSSLESPLTVLYSFLTYYSMFNWDKYCISLDGPVAISSLPDIVVETPASYGCDLLIGKEFLKSYTEFFSSPTMAFETKDQPFAVKHLNIIDPLRNNSNLGRSVGEGNFYRIRSALSYGARKLREILMHPKECIGEELKKFFVTTLDRNGRHRPDVQVPFIRHDGQFTIYDLSGDYRSYLNGLYYGQNYHNYKLPTHPLVTYSCLAQNKSPCMQFYMDDWTPVTTNNLIPSSICHSNDFLLSRKEMANFLETGTLIRRWGIEEKLMLLDTGRHITDVGVIENNKFQGSFSCMHTLGGHQKLQLQRSACIPEIGVEQNLKLRVSEAHKLNTGFGRKARLRRPTYGPDTRVQDKAKLQKVFLVLNSILCCFHPLKERSQLPYCAICLIILQARENSEPKTQAINKTSSQKVEEVEETLDRERDEIGSCFNLSLEEFPLLPSSKKAVLLENNLSIQAKTGSPEAQNARAYNLIEFGSLGHPSMRSLLSSPVAIELPKSGLLNTTTKETMLGSLTTAAQGPENSSECIDTWEAALGLRLVYLPISGATMNFQNLTLAATSIALGSSYSIRASSSHYTLLNDVVEDGQVVIVKDGWEMKMFNLKGEKLKALSASRRMDSPVLQHMLKVL